MTNFLPKGYEALKTEKSYWKPSDMKEGDNKFRIIMQPIAGWIDWIDKKPKRYRPDEKPSKAYDSEKPIKAFWCLYVWDYAREGLFILEIAQMSILKAMIALATDEDWGDFTKYDLKINKTGADLKTRYALTALPHKEINNAIKQAIQESPVRLEALYDGLDPWTDLEDYAAPDMEDSFSSDLEVLKEHMVIDGIDDSALESFLEAQAKKKNKSVQEVIESALMPEVLPKFKEVYRKELERLSA